MMLAEAPNLSAFARSYEYYSGLGLPVIPLVPGKKYPAIEVWQRHCDVLPTNIELRSYARKRDAGIGSALGLRVGDYRVIAVDLDVEGDALDLLASAIPASPMEKRGAKGLTRLFLADPSIKTTRFNGPDGQRLVDLLARGTQTVLPPTIHPDTGAPYVWASAILPTVNELPIFSDDDMERLTEALRAVGWNGRDQTRHAAIEATSRDEEYEEDDPARRTNRELNTTAMANFASWVPHLGLHGCRAKLGGYEAVATWRPSSGGNPVELRKRNLSFHATGIVDFGDGAKGYSPIDVVMAALDLSQAAAFGWLQEKTGYGAELDNLIPLAALDAMEERTRIARLAKVAERQAAEQERSLPEASLSSSITWDDREGNAAKATSWLIKGLLTSVGVSLLWGQSGSGKGFVSLDLAASIITGESFFDRRVKATGGVFFALGEGVGSMPLRLDALRQGRFGGMAPHDPLSEWTLNLDRLPIAWMPVHDLSKPAMFSAFAKDMRLAAKTMEEIHNRPLRLIVVDTVVASFGFDEDPDASKVTAAMKALDGLAKELDVLVLAVHHAGKSKQAGEHGSYAWRGSAEESINVDCDKDPLLGTTSNHRLILVKTRHGVEGWNRPFTLRSVPLGFDGDGDEISSAVVDVPALGARSERPQAGAPGTSRILSAFASLMTFEHCFDDGEIVHAVTRNDLQSAYCDRHLAESVDTQRRAFRRDLEKATQDAAVQSHGDGDNQIMWLSLAANDNNTA